MGSTVLAYLVRDWGDSLLIGVTDSLLSSDLFKAILYFVAMLVFIQLAKDLAEGARPYRTGIFFVSWLLVMPISNRPAFYYLVHSFSLATSNLLQKAMQEILTANSTKKSLPPGFVFNAIIKAQAAEIIDPSIRADICVLIDQCIPDAKNQAGQPLSAMDLFSGRVRATASSDSVLESTDTLELDFHPDLLKNRHIQTAQGIRNCYDLLGSTLKRLRSHLKGQNLTFMPEQIYRGANSGSFNDGPRNLNEKYVTTWDQTSPRAQRMAQIAVNISQAHAIQKLVLEEYFDVSNIREWKGGTQSPLTLLSANAFADKRGTILDPTKVVVEVANLPTAIARTLNLDGAIDAGLALHTMNERLVKLPYFVSNIQMLLKLLAPLVIFLLLFPKMWGVVTAWAVAWFATLNVPVILMFSRSISNMIIIWTTKLEDITAAHSNHPAFLNTGVSFKAANALMQDAGYWMTVFLEVENLAWNALFLGAPVVGGLLVHFKGSQLLAKLGEASMATAGRTIGGNITQKTTAAGLKSGGAALNVGGTVAKGIAGAAMPFAAGPIGAGVYAASLAGKAFSKVTKFAKGRQG